MIDENLSKDIETALLNVRKKSPLVHCITNYVTVNDCANVLLACGASPVMSDEIRDCVDITSISSALVLNIGTLTKRTIKSMKASCRKANQKGIPVVLDPVGAGATTYRTKTTLNLLKNNKITVLRGNISEVKTVFGAGGATKGVDANKDDLINGENLESTIEMAKALALSQNIIVSISGKTDIITDGKKTYLIENGNAKMGNITGTGCQSTALIAAFLAANPTIWLEAVAAAVLLIGVAGDIALKQHENCGNSTYRNYIIDEICNMSPEKLLEYAKLETR